ncbi:SCO family protein [Shimia sp. R11_0]|uniref:SCO family protein n=1 Tax=Shimia sp. R11_0 TaxID=2821096 RepID=UPI001ADC0C00|nr:SCO family protein [Shimia sp. R11_0]MBO9476177.1 SCO family protein [Shimia sp. R11_0]
MVRMVAAVAAFVAVLALAAMWFVGRETGGGDQFAQCRTSQVAGGTSAIGGAFELVHEDGQTVTDKDVLTEPSLIYFGYTYCPDVCPLDATRNAEAVEILEGKGDLVTPVFITIDPERDTPDVLKEFTDYLHPRMVGLSGSAEQIKAASQAYRTYYKKQAPEDGDEEYYLVDHSTFTYLTLPGHGFVEYFRRDISAEDMAQRVGCFVENM